MINKALIATTAFVFISIWDDPGELVLVSLGRTPDLGVFKRQKPLAAQPRAWEGGLEICCQGLRTPLHITHGQLQDHKRVPVTAAELFGPYNPLCCCSQGGSPALRLHAGTGCNSSRAEELQQGCGCRLGRFALAFRRSSQSITVIRQGGCSQFQCDGKAPLLSGLLSCTVCGLGNDMQALFLVKNFTAPEVFIKVDISKGKQVLGVMEKDCMPLFFSSVSRQACISVVSAFPSSSTKTAVVQGLESESRSNLNPLTTKTFLTGQVLLNLVSCD